MAIFIVRAVMGNDNFSYTLAPYFSDVAPSDFGFQWIQKMKDLGITSGCGANLYCPNDGVTRDQMAVFIIRARYGAYATFDVPATPYFTDVQPLGAALNSNFAFNSIQRMKLDTITSGCSPTTYCPHSVVTRGDMAIFVMRGAFNRLLSANTPVISSITPSTIPRGTTAAYTITGVNTDFLQEATTLAPMPGITFGAVNVTSATSLTVQLTAASDAVLQPVSVRTITPTFLGGHEAVLPNGLVLE
jgi:hypothetical protein